MSPNATTRNVAAVILLAMLALVLLSIVSLMSATFYEFLTWLRLSRILLISNLLVEGWIVITAVVAMIGRSEFSDRCRYRWTIHFPEQKGYEIEIVPIILIPLGGIAAAGLSHHMGL
ncbi:hypothetical protein A2480_02575 [Candidatus Uhrbacteria bacterium RIFOXYC2_FULL_47_19]|uniref:Uncharacterized protein n=1 Tax=Candidatus Uhrbacteria bacterium RIFOXYC2_FULL_47_19 TaxID=1802424 RepID=A0A1F7WFI7_9BACT|nr:MAG: hypothetical protein A2480_02575 [Candidatus Uhrbacteria bacterium RIFOXYC2_FULL_47_19]